MIVIDDIFETGNFDINEELHRIMMMKLIEASAKDFDELVIKSLEDMDKIDEEFIIAAQKQLMDDYDRGTIFSKILNELKDEDE